MESDCVVIKLTTCSKITVFCVVPCLTLLYVRVGCVGHVTSYTLVCCLSGRHRREHTTLQAWWLAQEQRAPAKKCAPLAGKTQVARPVVLGLWLLFCGYVSLQHYSVVVVCNLLASLQC